MSAWTQIALPEPKPKQAKGGKPAAESGQKKKRRNLSKAKWDELRARCAAGESRAALALEYGVAIGSVYKHTAGLGHTSSKPAAEASEKPAERAERPRAKTPDWVRRRAVARAQELQNTIAAREKTKAELERELTGYRKEFNELQAWLQDN